MFKSSLVTRLTALLCVLLLVGIGGLSYMLVSQKAGLMTAQMSKSNSATAEAALQQIAGGVKWGKTDAVAKVLRPLFTREGSELEATHVIDAKGGVVLEETSERSAEGPIADHLGAMVADATNLLGEEPFLLTSDLGHNIVIAAVVDPKSGKTVGHAGFAWTLAPLNARIAESRILSSAAGLGVAIVTLGALFFLLRSSVSQPLRALEATMTELAAGAETPEIPGLGRADEIGKMSAALAVFRDNAEHARRLAAEKVEAEAKAAEAMRAAEAKEAEAREDARRREAEQQAKDAEREREAQAAEALKTKREAEAKAAARAAAEDDRRRMMERLRDGFGEIVDAATRGDFSGRVEANFDDEILNELARGLNRMAETVGAGLKETCEMLAAIDRYDLSVRVTGDYQGDFAQLKKGVNNTADELTKILSELGASSSSLKGETDVLARGFQDLSGRTAGQASQVEETAAAVDMLTRSISKNAERAAQARDKAGSVEKAVTNSGEVMKGATEAMDQMVASSKKIADIVALIDGIAFQTNLLSLNASVEAARAGHAGAGFAVVAAEVRNLAQSTANSSGDIRKLIEQSQAEVTEGVELVSKAASNLHLMVDSIGEVTVLMREISENTSEQANRLTEVNDVVTEFDQATQRNAQMVDQSLQALDSAASGVAKIDKLAGSFVFQAEGAAAPTEETAGDRKVA